MGQFGEFTKRMDERFDHVNELAEQRFAAINQRLADAEKAREQNLVHINQRFDGLERRMDQFHADMLQMRNWLVRLYGLVVFGFIAAIAADFVRRHAFQSAVTTVTRTGFPRITQTGDRFWMSCRFTGRRKHHDPYHRIRR